MRSTATRSDAPGGWRRSARHAVLAILLATGLSAAGPAERLTDPVFGLAVTMPTASIPPAPASLMAACPDLANARWDRKAWVFGQVETPERSLTLIAGQFVDRRRPGTHETDAKGAIVLRQGDTCRLFGPAREVFDYGDDAIDPADLGRLASDSVARLRQAMGGADPLRAALAKAGAVPTAERSRILVEALGR